MSCASSKLIGALIHLLQKELERERGKFTKERQQFQARIEAEERAKRTHQVLYVNVSECIATCRMPHVYV